MTELKAFLAKLHQNLNILQEREAKYSGNAPLQLLNQIYDHQQAITLTEQAIRGELSQTEWREALKPLLVAIEARSSGEAASSVTIGNLEGGIYGSEIAGRDISIGQKIVNIFTADTSQQRDQRNRQAMLRLVKDFWVKGVLEQSLHGAVLIELGMEQRQEAVERPWDMVLQTPDQPDRTLPPDTKIVDVFDEMGQSLLILGEPGSGKTTMLLELARDLIACAEQDFTQPIPVVFNLSSWTEKKQPIAEWLLEELNTKYNIPKGIARLWVENDELLLLLDGLDEVASEWRAACVKAINLFRREHLMPLAVCSRIADYEALTIRLRLQSAVLLQPLTTQQIDKYLEGIGIEFLAVRKTLKQDVKLQELLQSPLMLSIMTLAYQGMSFKDLQTLTQLKLAANTYLMPICNRCSNAVAMTSVIHQSKRLIG
jgi:hypothetical protein